MTESFALVALLSATVRAEVPACPSHTGNPDEMEEKGRALFEEALRREPADPRAALEILSCVQRIADKPAVSLRVGLISERLGNKRAAAESFERYLALAGDTAPDREAMLAHIATLRAEVSAARPTPREAPPEEPPPARPPKRDTQSSPTAGYVTLAAGGVLMIVGGVLLVSAKNRNDTVHDLKAGETHWNSAEAKGEIDSAKREQTLGFIGLAAGALASGIGVYLVLDKQSGVSASARVGPRSTAATLNVRF
ncbi:MAG: hypothetical protein IPI67_34515 [Myxococcales bacterium]|nr:hypothetical protein [Myxococcales bacterium]